MLYVYTQITVNLHRSLKTQQFIVISHNISHFQTHNTPICSEENLIFNKNGNESFGPPSYVFKSKPVCNHALLTQTTQSFQTGG